jgi:hypothetical protein
MTHCASVFDEIDTEFETEMDDPPPTHCTTTATTMTTVSSSLTTQFSSYAYAVTRNLQQQLKEDLDELSSSRE